MILEITMLLVIAISIIAIESRDLVFAVILLGAADLLCAVAFLFMAAPDIAMTQASITTGLSVFIFMVVISKTRRSDHGG